MVILGEGPKDEDKNINHVRLLYYRHSKLEARNRHQRNQTEKIKSRMY